MPRFLSILTLLILSLSGTALAQGQFNGGGGGGITTVLGSAPPQQSVSTVYSSPQCPSPSKAGCYFANWDTHFVHDATTQLNNSTVTAPDGNFTGTDAYGRPIAKVGQIVFVTSDGLNGTLTCPQSTIQSINSATSVTLATASDCTGAALTGTGWLYWGDDDTTNLNNAWAATNCGALYLPGPPANETAPGNVAMAMFQSAIFITQPACDIVTVDVYQGPSLYGAAVQSTYVLATPNFSFSTCTGGGNQAVGSTTNVCIGGVENGHYRDFTVWGGGNNGATSSGSNGKYLFELGDAARAESVDVQGWCSSCSNVVGVVNNSSNGWFAEGGGIFSGQIACQSNNIQTIWEGNFCEGIQFGLRIGAGVTSIGISNAIEAGNGSAAAAVDITGQFSSIGDKLIPLTTGTSGFQIETGGVLYSYAQTTVDMSAFTGNTALYMPGSTGTAYLNGTLLKGGASAQDIYMSNAAEQVFCAGATQFNGATHLGNSGTGQMIGNCPTGWTLLTAAKLVLSANWGTTRAVSAPTGYNSPITFTITNGSASTGTAPTIAYTFPAPYVVAPLFCNATQVGGTNAIGTFTSSSLSATGVTFTYSLTPTASDTELIQVSCGLAQ